MGRGSLEFVMGGQGFEFLGLMNTMMEEKMPNVNLMDIDGDPDLALYVVLS